MLSKLKGVRTVLFNVAVAVAGVLWGDEAAKAITALGVSLDVAESALWAAWGAANVALRAVTDTPIFKKST